MSQRKENSDQRKVGWSGTLGQMEGHSDRASLHSLSNVKKGHKPGVLTIPIPT